MNAIFITLIIGIVFVLIVGVSTILIQNEKSSIKLIGVGGLLASAGGLILSGTYLIRSDSNYLQLPIESQSALSSIDTTGIWLLIAAIVVFAMALHLVEIKIGVDE